MFSNIYHLCISSFNFYMFIALNYFFFISNIYHLVYVSLWLIFIQTICKSNVFRIIVLEPLFLPMFSNKDRSNKDRSKKDWNDSHLLDNYRWFFWWKICDWYEQLFYLLYIFIYFCTCAKRIKKNYSLPKGFLTISRCVIWRMQYQCTKLLLWNYKS